MDSNSVLWIVIAAVVAIAVIAVVVFFTRKAGNRCKQQQADQLRAEVEHDSARVNRQASLVEEAEAKARAAQAEAEAKAAEASRLADTASTRRDALSSSQDELASRRAHADKLDPRVKSDGTRKDGETDLTAETAGDSAVDAPTHRDSTAR